MTIPEKAELIIRDIKKETSTSPVQIFRNLADRDYISMHGPEHHILDGPRCCKRDAMLAFKNCIAYVNEHYPVTLEYEDLKCKYSACNEQCIKERCPYYK